MQWIAPSQKDNGNQTLEKRLWEAADELRANSGLNSAQYSTPVLDLIFLRFAEAPSELRKDSDVDILVEFHDGEAPSLFDLARVERELSTLVGGRTVD